MNKSSNSTSVPTVLVTGVAGYIGSHFALACLAAGWRVIGIDNLSVGSRGAVPEGVDFREIDCADPQVANLICDEKIDVAVHFAALISVEESVQKPADYYQTNVCKSLAFFEHASQAGIGGVVFSSTAAVYGETGAGPVAETVPVVPTSPYGRTKLATEWILNDLSASSGVRHVILRYFNVAGADEELRAGPRAGATHLIKIVAEAATGQRPLVTINGDDLDTPDGTAVRDYIHVSDLADAHICAVRHILGKGASLTLNVGYGTGYSVREVIDAACELADVPFPARVGPRRPGDIESLVADSTALRQQFGWVARRDDLSVILQTAIDWERKQLAAANQQAPK